MYRTNLPCQTECEQASDPNMAQAHAHRMLISILFRQALQTAMYESVPKGDIRLLCVSFFAICFFSI